MVEPPAVVLNARPHPLHVGSAPETSPATGSCGSAAVCCACAAPSRQHGTGSQPSRGGPALLVAPAACNKKSRAASTRHNVVTDVVTGKKCCVMALLYCVLVCCPHQTLGRLDRSGLTDITPWPRCMFRQGSLGMCRSARVYMVYDMVRTETNATDPHIQTCSKYRYDGMMWRDIGGLQLGLQHLLLSLCLQRAQLPAHAVQLPLHCTQLVSCTCKSHGENRMILYRCKGTPVKQVHSMAGTIVRQHLEFVLPCFITNLIWIMHSHAHIWHPQARTCSPEQQL